MHQIAISDKLHNCHHINHENHPYLCIKLPSAINCIIAITLIMKTLRIFKVRLYNDTQYQGLHLLMQNVSKEKKRPP